MKFMDKHEIARILEEIATLLELQGENPFKIRAYKNAARTIESIDEDIACLVRKGNLEDLPGIGEHIAEKITQLIKKGRLPYYEKLKRSVPKGVLQLLQVPGLGGKRIKILCEKLKISSLQSLAKACRAGKVSKLAGFGKRLEQNILQGVEKRKAYGKRMLFWDALELAQPILAGLSRLKEVKKVELAGSLRRKLETAGDIDILAVSKKPKAVMNWFTSQPWVERVIAKGVSKSAIRLKGGFQADLRIVLENEFGCSLLYFTGSKQHNIHIRKIAIERGYSLSEYGLEGARLKKNATEKEIYKTLGLDFIPPELREDLGEIESAQKHKLPHLVEEKDIRGAFHCHTTASDGHNSLEEMALAAAKLKWEYLGISDHSKSSYQANGLSADDLLAQAEKIYAFNRSGKIPLHLFAGVECDILANGKLDFPDSVLKELDFVIVSIHSSFKKDSKAMTKRLVKAIENPYTTMIGHPTGRLLLRRDAYPIDMQKVIDACIANKKVMELNAHPLRLDMDWRLWHHAQDKGLKCSINPDAHSVRDLSYVQAGVGIARKGWLGKETVINSYSLNRLVKFLKNNLN